MITESPHYSINRLLALVVVVCLLTLECCSSHEDQEKRTTQENQLKESDSTDGHRNTALDSSSQANGDETSGETIDTRFIRHLTFTGKVKAIDSLISRLHTDQISYWTRYGYVIEKSELPQLTGLSDTVFQHRVNEELQNNFRSWLIESFGFNGFYDYQAYVRDTRIEYGEDSDEYLSIAASGYTDFQYTYSTPSIITIVQTFGDLPSGGGNGWGCGVTSTCIDIRNHRILHPEDFGLSLRDTARINRCMYSYLKKEFAVEFYEKGCFYVTKPSDFQSIALCPSKGMLYLYREAYPASHVTHTIYRVPLWKFSGYFKTGKYLKKPEIMRRRKYPVGHF